MVLHTDIAKLIKSDMDGSLDEAGQARLEEWLSGEPGRRDFYLQLVSDQYFRDQLASLRSVESEKVWKLTLGKIKDARIVEMQNLPSAVTLRFWSRYATPLLSAAATLLLIAGAWFYVNFNRKLPTSASQQRVADIAPGNNSATLTLAGGKILNLSSAKSGVVISTTDIKYNDGSKVAAQIGNELLTASTPIGGTYQFTLPDGTQVQLNAGSSITFPASFASSDDRNVTLIGEAFFQVAKDPAHPFVVKAGTQKVEVLGTKFNINNYRDEPAIKTTLLEGSIRLDDRLVLRPGEEAINQATKTEVFKVNPLLAISWTQGRFYFKDESLEVIMRQVARWYAAEVVFTSEALKNTHFSGTLSRYDNVSSLLNTISLSGMVIFKIDGRTITVSSP